MSLSENLKNLMDADPNITSLSALARRTGVSKQTISLIIQGKLLHPRKPTIDKIASYFNCTEDELVDKNNTKNNIPSNLKKIMSKRGLSLGDLAKESGIHKSVIGKIVNGKTRTPKVDTLTKICSSLGVSYDRLAG